jgi:hypothetical protein
MATVVNRILLYLLLVGVGAIAGLGVFHVLYETSCTDDGNSPLQSRSVHLEIR